MFENPRRGGQARNLTTNVAKILDLKSSPNRYILKNWRRVPLQNVNNPEKLQALAQLQETNTLRWIFTADVSKVS